MNAHAQSALDTFRQELDLSLAIGALADLKLLVTDRNGEFPVIAALSGERLEVLLGRVRSVGGFANIFVLDQIGEAKRVAYLPTLPVTEAIGGEHSLDMTGDERPSANATVAVFLEFLALHPEGVLLPVGLDDGPFVKDPQVVDFDLALAR